MESKNISRRSFLKLFGAGAVGTAAVVAGCKDKVSQEVTDEYKNQVEPPVGKMTYRENPRTRARLRFPSSTRHAA